MFTRIHTRTRAHARKHSHPLTPTHTHTHTHARRHARTQARTHARTHARTSMPERFAELRRFAQLSCPVAIMYTTLFSFTVWGEWSACSESCGTAGVRTIVKYCNGIICNQQEASCNRKLCEGSSSPQYTCHCVVLSAHLPSILPPDRIHTPCPNKSLLVCHIFFFWNLHTKHISVHIVPVPTFRTTLPFQP